MTKQEKIKEGIVNWFLERNPDKTKSWAEWETKMLFIKQDSQGVMIRVDRKLPEPYEHIGIAHWLTTSCPACMVSDYKRYLDKAGYEAVESLILT